MFRNDSILPNTFDKIRTAPFDNDKHSMRQIPHPVLTFHKMKSELSRSNLSIDTEKLLCKFLVSPFRNAGLRSYKTFHKLSFPEPSRQVANRLAYLKSVQQKQRVKFEELLKSYKIDSNGTSFDDSSVASDSTSRISKPSTVSIPTVTRTHNPKQTFTMMSPTSPSSSSSHVSASMRRHQYFLNLASPHLNKNGMLWFRDDDVEIDDALYSVLTIYQPLFDARDTNNIKMSVDSSDPGVLHHEHPNIPFFMVENFKKMHKLEETTDQANPELYSFTYKKHQKCALKIMRGADEQKNQVDTYKLPFNLVLDNFSTIQNSESELQKNYRTLTVDVTDKIMHKCAFIFWKVLIDGESTSLLEDFTSKKTDFFADAEARMSKLNLNDNNANGDDSDAPMS